jgi:imidazolonepropionase-like amidohydrolase
MSEQADLVIQAELAFDGAAWLESVCVVVHHGLITEVTTGEPPPSRVTVARPGTALLPGFIDAHTHIGSRSALERCLIFGVTTEFDMFMDWRLARELRSAIADGELLADFRTAGTLATSPGGHGTTQLVGRIPTLTRPEEADQFVRDRIAEGSDYLKIVHDDLAMHAPPRPTLDPVVVEALAAAAHAQGLRCVAHIGTRAGALAAMDAGVDVLGHLFVDAPPPPDFGRRASDRSLALIPTLSLLRAMTGERSDAAEDPRLAPYLTERDRHALSRTVHDLGGRAAGDLRYAFAAVRQARDAGATILAGTDAPYPGATHGAAIHSELELLVQAGLTPTEALAAATSGPAACFELADRGTIAPGRRADLLLVEGDPRRDIRTTRAISDVWLRGERVERHAYREQVAARTVPRLVVPGDGVLCDFTRGTSLTVEGHGWDATDDSRTGGASRAELTVGARPDGYHLRVEAHLDPITKLPWAGCLLSPGPTRLGVTDLSAYRSLFLRVRGDGGVVMAVLFTENRSMFASPNMFLPTSEDWCDHELPFEHFQTDGDNITGLLLTALGPSPERWFEVDEVRLA